jgi:hypothetical protein
MPITKKAAEFVGRIANKYPKEEQGKVELAAKKVDMAKKPKDELEAISTASKSINDRLAADSEIIRREKNKEKRKSGEAETKAPDYKDLRKDFNQGGMVTKSRSNPLNKFYGK